MGELKDEVTRLRAELDALKAALPTPYDAASAARWQSEMHELRERQATSAAASAFSKADLAAMEAACPPDTVRAIVSDNRGGTSPRSAAAMPVSATPGPVAVPGGGTGWMRETPLRSPEGVAVLDKIMDHQDAVDRHELMLAEAKRLAMVKAPEPK